MNQIFASKNISFVEVTELLTDDYLVMVNDYENVNRFIGKRRELYTKEQEAEWVRKKRAEGAVVFSMVEKGSGAFIGNIELMDESDSAKELGIAITADMQNKGYGTEAVFALVESPFLGFSSAKISSSPSIEKPNFSIPESKFIVRPLLVSKQLVISW